MRQKLASWNPITFPEWFINYVANPTRSTPVNLATVRVILGLYVIWRVLSINLDALLHWPVHFHNLTILLYPPPGYEWILIVEYWALIAAATAFTLGLKTRITAFITGTLLAHITAILMLVNLSGETEQMALAALFIFFIGMYSEEDVLTLGTLAALRGVPAGILFNGGDHDTQTLTDTFNKSEYRATSLKYILIVLAITYAGAVYMRTQTDGLSAWTDPENFTRFFTYHHDLIGQQFFVGELLMKSDTALTVVAWGTNIIELGLLVALLLGASITPVIILLIVLHTGIALAMGIVFFDLIIFLMCFAAYDQFNTRIPTDDPIEITVNSNATTYTPYIGLFKLLDANERISWKQNPIMGDSIHLESPDGIYTNGDALIELAGLFYITTPAHHALRAIQRIR